ncbi:MAG: M2 family metallopeptidase [Planctomycetaceae bacterium]|nr:M2 family metallopeptidase [Planctomycetaceae bacterium]
MKHTTLCCCVLALFVLGTVAVAQEIAQDNRLRDRIRAAFGNPGTNAPGSGARTMNDAARELVKMLDEYQIDAAELHKNRAHATWDARTTGEAEAFQRSAETRLQVATYHSNRDTYAKIKELRQQAVGLSPITARAAERMEQAFARNQLPEDLQKQMVEMSSEMEKIFQNYRPILDGREYTNNDLLEMIAAENDCERRKEIWEALKQVGEVVNEKIIALVKVRNKAAQELGYNNFWEMQVILQDYDPAELLEIFDNLERSTRPLFARMKAELDAELAQRFGIPADQLMPWHYDNPFFQQAPPSKDVNPTDFYRDKTKEEIVEIALRYFRRVGLPFDRVAERSDMFEREGKDQHAFSIDMDRQGDVRNLNNVKPTAEWMDTVLHEAGHGVYSLGLDPRLPFNLRQPAHIFATEGVAMMFGAKAREPQWLVQFAGADRREVRQVAQALAKQRVREQLIFCRWSLVMLYFEKALYENPDADLKALWWDIAGKYQLLRRPVESGQELADWASKPHFVIAPVYYHNYQMGELYAAQLRASFGTRDNVLLGRRLQERVFVPADRYTWQDFVRYSTGRAFSPEYFARELR